MALPCTAANPVKAPRLQSLRSVRLKNVLGVVVMHPTFTKSRKLGKRAIAFKKNLKIFAIALVGDTMQKAST
ncbi:MAG TPA: hypothetical protein V6D29_10095 [Leptolyngbyaceae cyanobacterium]